MEQPKFETINNSNEGYRYKFYNYGFYMGSDFNHSFRYEDTSMFILDNETGKIYNMQEVVKVTKEIFSIDDSYCLKFVNLDNNNFAKEQGYVGINRILLSVEGYVSGSYKIWGIIQITLTDSGMEVTKRLSKYNINTGDYGEIDSCYSFKDLSYNKNTDKIVFKAIDNNTLEEVNGYFSENGEIFIGDFNGIDYGKTKVYLIKPVN